MSTRPQLSPTAAVGIWAASLIGSWTMATAILGSMNRAAIGCDPDSAPPTADSGGVGGWVILALSALLPVLVMAAIAPAEPRRRLVGLAAVTAAAGFLAAYIWIGPCL